MMIVAMHLSEKNTTKIEVESFVRVMGTKGTSENRPILVCCGDIFYEKESVQSSCIYLYRDPLIIVLQH